MAFNTVLWLFPDSYAYIREQPAPVRPIHREEVNTRTAPRGPVIDTVALSEAARAHLLRAHVAGHPDP